MTIRKIQCPSCKTTLKTSTPSPVTGKRAKCPRCGHLFVPEEGNIQKPNARLGFPSAGPELVLERADGPGSRPVHGPYSPDDIEQSEKEELYLPARPVKLTDKDGLLARPSPKKSKSGLWLGVGIGVACGLAAILIGTVIALRGDFNPVRETASCFEEIADILSTIHDQKSAEEARPNLEKVAKRLNNIHSSPNKSSDWLLDFKDVSVRDVEAYQTAVSRVQREILRVGWLSGGPELLNIFGEVMAADSPVALNVKRENNNPVGLALPPRNPNQDEFPKPLPADPGIGRADPRPLPGPDQLPIPPPLPGDEPGIPNPPKFPDDLGGNPKPIPLPVIIPGNPNPPRLPGGVGGVNPQLPPLPGGVPNPLPQVPGLGKQNEKFNRENLDKVQIGMTTDRVKEIIGPPLRVSVSSIRPGRESWAYLAPGLPVWIHFQDGKVSMKQGLK